MGQAPWREPVPISKPSEHRFVGVVEVTQDRNRFVERRRGTAADAALSICFGKQNRIKKVGVGFEPLACPVAERAVGIVPRDRKMFDKPRGAGCDQAVERLEAGSDGISAIDGEAYVMGQRRGEHLLVAGAFVVDDGKDLEGVFEGVPLRVPCRILSHRLENCHERREPIKPIADDRGERARWIEAAVDFAADLVIVGQAIVGHPAMGDASGRAEDRSPCIGASRHMPGRLACDFLAQSVR